jgi:hypothetical protein
MPTCLPFIRKSNLKSIKLTALFLLSPLFFFAQSLTGLWVGTISNDSNTVRKDQSFEIALTEYRGKVYGYSRSEFIVDDVLYYIMKRVTGTIEGDVCEVTDDEIISYNFPKQLDKKVKVTSTFRRDKNDSAWHLDGKWKTNVTKKYYSVTGNVDLEEEKDLTASKIFPHLEELKLADDVAFYKDRKEAEPIVRIAKPEKTTSEFSTNKVPLSNNNNTKTVTVSTKPSFSRAPVESTPATATTELKKQEVTSSSNEKTSELVKTNSKEELTTIKEPSNVSPKPDTKNLTVTTAPVTSSPVSPQTSPEAKKAEVITSSNKPDAKTIAINTTPVASATDSKTTAEVKKTESITSANKPETKSVAINTVPVTSTVSPQATAEVKKVEIVPSSNRPNTVAVNNTPAEKKEIKTEPIAKAVIKQEPPAVKNQQPTTTKQPDIIQKKPETNSITVTTPPVKTNAVTTASPVAEKKDITTENVAIPLTPEVKKPEADITLKAALIAGRKSEFSQIVNFKADSLELSLYDNGEIDGDTVTIFMNGEAILSKQGLKASAIKKTIYITPGNEEFTLVMFAESLGKYPPNTGLLVIHDGEDIYNLRFSSDYQKNSGIVFRRKK